MNHKMTNECYDMIASIHHCETYLVYFFSGYPEHMVKPLHEALRKRKEYLSKLVQSVPVTMKPETLFTVP